MIYNAKLQIVPAATPNSTAVSNAMNPPAGVITTSSAITPEKKPKSTPPLFEPEAPEHPYKAVHARSEVRDDACLRCAQIRAGVRAAVELELVADRFEDELAYVIRLACEPLRVLPMALPRYSEITRSAVPGKMCMGVPLAKSSPPRTKAQPLEFLVQQAIGL